VIEVHEVPDRQRYEATLDGTVAGFAMYRDIDGVRVFTHTEVLERFEGRGVGGALARAALDDVREAGRSLVPLCPFVRSYIDKHPDDADLVDVALDARLGGG
jgi:uncharacterized protein